MKICLACLSDVTFVANHLVAMSNPPILTSEQIINVDLFPPVLLAALGEIVRD